MAVAQGTYRIAGVKVKVLSAVSTININTGGMAYLQSKRVFAGLGHVI
jgi:hypothetical protein